MSSYLFGVNSSFVYDFILVLIYVCCCCFHHLAFILPLLFVIHFLLLLLLLGQIHHFVSIEVIKYEGCLPLSLSPSSILSLICVDYSLIH